MKTLMRFITDYNNSFRKAGFIGKIVLGGIAFMCLCCFPILILFPSDPTPSVVNTSVSVIEASSTLTPEPTMGIIQAIAGTSTAAAALTIESTITSFPVYTNTIEPSFTTAPTFTSIPTNTPFIIPTNTLIVVVPTSAPAAGVCSCSGDTLNCKDFSSHASAQACFSYCVSIGRGDIHGLDGNNDGNACESLP